MKSVKQSVGGSSKAAVEIKIGSIVSAALKNKGGGIGGKNPMLASRRAMLGPTMLQRCGHMDNVANQRTHALDSSSCATTKQSYKGSRRMRVPILSSRRVNMQKKGLQLHIESSFII